YGLIFHSSFIGKAGSKNKGRISRYLANKCSIASRIDCFSEFPRTSSAEAQGASGGSPKVLRDRDIPKKNVEVMQEAIAAVKEEAESFKVVKKEKKKKKRKAEELEEEEPQEAEAVEEPSKKKKKKAEPEEPVAEDDETVSPKKKKKKKSK
ncbi:Nucleolar protein 5A, partial [Caligus rogercresseyi]